MTEITETYQATEKKPTGNSMKMLTAMVGIGLLCALMIVLTYEGTFSRVEKLRAEALEKAIFKVLPGTKTTRTYQYTSEQGFIAVEGSDNGKAFYAGYDENGELSGIAIEASGQGYADRIKILYGFDPQKLAIVGFYVLESKETPGLGDKIEKDEAFLANFKALDVSLNESKSGPKNKIIPVKSGTKTNPWEVDCITGATISSEAIGNMLGLSTEKWVPLIYQDIASFNRLEATNE